MKQTTIASDSAETPPVGTGERDLKQESRRNRRLRFGSFRVRLPERRWLQEHAVGVLDETKPLVSNRLSEPGFR